jgi:hypothetical protein
MWFMMKKILLFISAFLFCLVCVNAGEFKGEDDFVTMINIENYVESNIAYEFNWHPQTVSKTLRTMKGDCTDKALLKCYYARKEGLRCRTVHGYADGTKHDWAEYKINREWISNERIFFNELKKTGNGIW